MVLPFISLVYSSLHSNWHMLKFTWTHWRALQWVKAYSMVQTLDEPALHGSVRVVSRLARHVYFFSRRLAPTVISPGG
jgi:hypothetical protein